jgi:DNA polymerase-3 subunit gamma/tau
MESVEYEEDAFNIIAQKADGAMRDALSVFDQVVSFSNGKVTYQKVIENLNILDYEYYFSLTDAFLSGDVPKCLILLDEILSKGFDAHNFTNGLSKHLRDLLVCKAENTVQLLEVGDTIRERYKEQSARCDNVFIFRALEICNQTDLSYRTSKNPRLHVELSLVKICNISSEKKK